VIGVDHINEAQYQAPGDGFSDPKDPSGRRGAFGPSDGVVGRDHIDDRLQGRMYPKWPAQADRTQRASAARAKASSAVETDTSGPEERWYSSLYGCDGDENR
jgi:hypothetical protein